MSYDHTQYGKLHYLLWVIAACIVIPVAIIAPNPPAILIPLVVAVVLILAAAMFSWLWIRDEGEYLEARFGPLPVFRKRIPYADITGVEEDRSLLVDGWGIHFMPGRGWIYNVWGRDCVKITLGSKVVRLGTDDRSRLADFLRSRMVSSGSDQPAHV